MNISTAFMDETFVYLYREMVENYVPTYFKTMEYTPWIFSLLGSALIGLSGILPLVVIPVGDRSDKEFKDHGHCRHRYRCLLCSDTNVFCNCSENNHTDHPKQPLVSDELLLSKYGSKANTVEYSEINIFGCPYCDRQQLSISALYDHLTLEHLDVPFDVRCPICVCFDGNYSLVKDIHLSKHLVDDHSVTMEQYHEQILVYDTYCDNEMDLLKFIACTLPPTYYGGEDQKGVTSPTTSTAAAKPTSSSKTLHRICSICLDFVFEAGCRELICKHKFHSTCISLWLQQSSTCPICRTSTAR